MIHSSEICVVVQGEVEGRAVRKCLRSVKKFLPEARVLLSTWRGENTSGLEAWCDEIIFNEDPGARSFAPQPRALNNVNRQMVSTLAGLERAGRKYALKLRTDFYLQDNSFLRYFDAFPLMDEKWRCFNRRVIACSVFSRMFSDENGLPTPFHVSDFFFFGETADLAAYFATPPMPAGDMGDYAGFVKNTRPYSATSYRYTPEQYYCYSFAKRKFPHIQFRDMTDVTAENQEQSRQILLNNFIFLGAAEAGIYSRKHMTSLTDDERVCGLISCRRFADAYSRHFNQAIPKATMRPPQVRYRRHRDNCLRQCKAFGRALSEAVCAASYLFKSLRVRLGKGAD